MATKEQIEAVVTAAKKYGYSTEEINSALKAKGFFSPSLNPTYTQDEKDKNFFGTVGSRIADFVNATPLGNRIGGMLGSLSSGYDNLSKATQQGQELVPKLEALIIKGKNLGQDTSRLEKTLADLKVSNAQSQQIYEDIPTGGVSNRQAAGSAISTVASAVPFGAALGRGATLASKGTGMISRAATPVLGTAAKQFAKPVVGSALEGAAGAAAFNLGSSIGNNQDPYTTTANTLVGAGLGAVGGAVLGFGANKIGQKIGQILNKEDAAGSIITKSTELLGVNPNQSTTRFNRQLFGVEDDITTSPRVIAFADMANELSGRSVRNLDKKLQPKTIQDIGDVKISDTYQIVEQRLREIYKQMDSEIAASGDIVDKRPIVKYLTDIAQDDITSRETLGKLGFNIGRKGELSIQPRGLLDRIFKANKLSDLERIASNELEQEVRAIGQSGQSASAKSTLAGLKKTLTETIDANVERMGGSSKDLRKLYGGYRDIEDSLKQLVSRGDPRALELLDTYGMSNILAGGAFNNQAQMIKGGSFFGLKTIERMLKMENRTLHSILKDAQAFNKFKNPATAAPQTIEKIPSIKESIKSPKQNGQAGKITTATTAAGALSLGGAAALANSKSTMTYEKQPSQEKVSSAKPDLRQGFIQAENRGARDRGENLYEQVGETGDIGKYQVEPETLRRWSEPWLGRTYTVEEFKKDPAAQEEFMNQFLAVVDAYGLTPEEAAIAWHKGWGAIGDQEGREINKKQLMAHIAEKRKDPEVQEYLKDFFIGLNNQ